MNNKEPKSLEQMYQESLAVIQSYKKMLDVIHSEMYEHKRFVLEYERSAA
jgi:septum formation topological specificity factor MinE